MKLSEAILRGSTMGPQIRHQLSNGKGTCAWGAAYLALGILGKAITRDLRADPLSCGGLQQSDPNHGRSQPPL
jgi:hypothetical protein